MEARSSSTPDEDVGQIEALVARIRARGATPLPKPDPEAVAQFLAHTKYETPRSDEGLDEHERIWRTVVAEVHALDRSTGSATALV